MGTMAPITTPGLLAQTLRDQIASGQLPQGSRLPGQRDLAEQHGVSRAVVRAALGELEAEGLLEARRPIGTFVRERHLEPYQPDPRPVSAALRVYLDQLRSSGGARDSEQAIAIVPCPPDVAAHLSHGVFLYPAGEAVLRRRTLLCVDGEPHRLSEEYIPPILFGGDTPPPLHSPELDAWLARIRMDRAVDLWTVRMPAPNERMRLRLPPSGVPVAVHTCVEHYRSLVARVTVTVLPGDRHIVVYERPGGPAKQVLNGL